MRNEWLRLMPHASCLMPHSSFLTREAQEHVLERLATDAQVGQQHVVLGEPACDRCYAGRAGLDLYEIAARPLLDCPACPHGARQLVRRQPRPGAETDAVRRGPAAERSRGIEGHQPPTVQD